MTPHTARARNAELNRDPTQTITIRRDYVRDARKRWRWLKGAIRDGVQGADALGIGQEPPSRPVVLQSPEVREELNRLRRLVRGATSEGNYARATELAREFISVEGRFAFPSSADKVEAFSGWLDEATDAGILQVNRGPGGEIVSRNGWQEVYVERSYRKGLRDADRRVAQAGIRTEGVADIDQSLQLPIHSEKLELLHARNFSELKGINEAAGQQIRRTLTEGLAEGVNPRRMATFINDRVGAVGLHRSRVMARTEVIRAHAEATLTRYEQVGIKQVAGKAEFATAGDSRVCPLCLGMEGEVFTIEEARTVIPVHPQCRCTWLPVVDNSRAQNLRTGDRDYWLAVQERAFPDWYRRAA